MLPFTQYLERGYSTSDVKKLEVKILNVAKIKNMCAISTLSRITGSQHKINKKLSYRRETARQLRIHAQLTRCFSAVAV